MADTKPAAPIEHADAPKAEGPSKHDDLLEEARKRYEYGLSTDDQNRKNAIEALRFCWQKGAQWPEDIRRKREQEDAPCLEINQLPQFVRQIVNDIRQNRPAVRVHPAGQKASQKVAKIISGLVRAIQYESKAPQVYDAAVENAVVAGRGYWRILTEYERDDSFDQRITIKRIADPNAVILDPDYVEPDASDAGWGFVLETVDKDEFESKYPDAEALDFSDKGRAGCEKWFDGDKVVVADYYRRTYKPRKLALLDDGSSCWADAAPEGKQVVKTRAGHECCVEWYKVAGGQQVLAEYKVCGQYIPLVMVIGEEQVIEGKRLFQGIAHRAMDVLRMYNYWQSKATEVIALAPKAPWVMAEGQDEGFEHMWENANRENYARLVYKPKSVGGILAPPPQRTQFAQVPTGIVEQANQAKQDVKSVIGMYENSLGMRGQETSGRAIIAREKQGDAATFHFADNLARAIEHTGRIIVGMIPHYYDAARIVRVLEEDDTQALQAINQQMPSPQGVVGEAAPELVIDPDTDLTSGRYAVAVDVGPSYATKRMESSDSMMAFVQAFPQSAPLIGDLVAKMQDWPGAEKFAERLRLMLPPNVQQAEQDGGDGEQSPELMAAQQQLQQMGQQMQQMQAEAQKAMGELQQKVGELSIQVKNREDEVAAKREDMEARNALDEKKLELEETKLAVEVLDRLIQVMQPTTPAQVPGLAAAADGAVEGMQGEGVMQAPAAPAVDLSGPVGVLVDKLTGKHRAQVAALHGAATHHATQAQSLAEALEDMHSAPRELVRGPDGRAHTVRIHTKRGVVERRIARDPNGQPIGLH